MNFKTKQQGLKPKIKPQKLQLLQLKIKQIAHQKTNWANKIPNLN